MNKIDKLKILKEVLFFKFTSNDLLEELISNMQEQVAEADELIIEKGTFGDEMYVILEGKVKVHDGDQIIAKIGSSNVFGELAALSPHVRIASVSAIEHSLLLKINHEMLYSLMKRNIGFVQGIIEVLCQRTRNMSNLQRELVQQQNLASLGLLSSGLAHELQNPLNFVINFTEVACDLIKELLETPSEDSTHYIDRLKNGIKELSDLMTKIILHGKRADGIIKRLLLHAHQGGANSEMTVLSSLLDKACSFSLEIFCKKAPHFKLNVTTKYDPAVKPIEVFPRELIQVFINIIDNACFAMNKKLQIDEHFVPLLEITLQDFADKVQVTFKDNGGGISQKHLQYLFQPLFTTKAPGEGTGLGLSISYDIITQQHAGRIEVHTDHISYTEFLIELPKAQK